MTQYTYPCPWCNRSVEKLERLKGHVQKVHGRLRCTNCGELLTKCKDFDAVGQAFACSSEEKK